jgi:ATP/maltotriose-dependent transcriptional regulator MalT
MEAGAFPRLLASGPAGYRHGPFALPVPRRRLAHLLDLTGDARLTSVIGPYGCGKRTVVRGWLDRRAQSWAWAVLAPSDDDGGALARRLRDATEFAAERANGLGRDGATVVIEHSHVIRSAAAVDAFGAWLAQTTHDHRVVAIGELSLPPAVHATGRRSIVELRAPDLQFTRTEIDELVAGCGLPASSAFADALLDITNGWAAAVDIATRCLLSDSQRGISQAIAELRDFVLTAVVPSLPDDLQCFLAELARTDRAELQLVATGGEQRPPVVQQALDRQLLVSRTGAERRLALHPYLAWALRAPRYSVARDATHRPLATKPGARRCAPLRDVRPAPRPSAAARRAYQLTRREADVLALLGSELTMREIAATLCVSRDTVKSHSRSIYRKLSVTSREDAVTTASAARLLE